MGNNYMNFRLRLAEIIDYISRIPEKIFDRIANFLNLSFESTTLRTAIQEGYAPDDHKTKVEMTPSASLHKITQEKYADAKKALPAATNNRVDTPPKNPDSKKTFSSKANKAFFEFFAPAPTSVISTDFKKFTLKLH